MKPNILIITPHDLGDHLRCYDHPGVRSPNLDRLAGEGVRFTNYFAAAPECTSSRSGMLTGLHPHQNGLVGLANFGWSIHNEVKHLAAHLRSGGYDTRLFGVQHETHNHPSSLGYNHATGKSRVEDVCDDVQAFLRSDEAKGDQPWFLSAGFFDVHRPWRHASTIPLDEIAVPDYLPDSPEMHEEFALFYQNIMEMDAAVGAVLDTLQQQGLDENTLVVFTTDHGAPFPGAKATLYDPGLRIPLIMRHPHLFEGGRTVDALLSNVDFTPAILELTDLPIPTELEGQSFRPELRGEEGPERDAIFASVLYDVAYDPVFCVRTATHKYIRSFGVVPEEAKGIDPRVASTFAAGRWIRVDDLDVLSSRSWAILAALGADTSRPPAEELYDLRSDPAEQSNIADAPEAGEALREMRGRLTAFLERTDAPVPPNHLTPPQKQIDACQSHQPGGVAFVNCCNTRRAQAEAFGLIPVPTLPQTRR